MNVVGVLTIHLDLPGCRSLKEKRGQLKPLLARLHREFNISVAEIGQQDKWSRSIIACAMLGNDTAHIQRSLETIQKWVETNYRDTMVVDNHIEIIK
jgi:uncharacterized protein YlxP (DUF503 family)